jgi:putative oxidoreductase
LIAVNAYDVGLLTLRLVLGLTMAAHGYKKFAGAGGIAGTARWFHSIGMRPGALHARLAAVTELAAGLGMAAGVFTPVCSAAFVALMLVAAWTVHRTNGFFITDDGWEYNLVLAASAVAVAAVGPGRYSVDYRMFAGTRIYHYVHAWPGLTTALGLGLAGGLAQLALFYRPVDSED